MEEDASRMLEAALEQMDGIISGLSSSSSSLSVSFCPPDCLCSCSLVPRDLMAVESTHPHQRQACDSPLSTPSASGRRGFVPFHEAIIQGVVPHPHPNHGVDQSDPTDV